MNIKDMIKEAETVQQAYIKKNFFANEIEKFMLHSAIEKKTIARDEHSWYEIIGKERIYLGSMNNFALNWTK